MPDINHPNIVNQLLIQGGQALNSATGDSTKNGPTRVEIAQAYLLESIASSLLALAIHVTTKES